jgi:hypothetical protein
MNLSNKFLFSTVCVLIIFLPLFVSAQSPGGVSTSLEWWLKADAGVTGDPVSDWTNQASAGGSATRTLSAQRPDFQSSVINGNPALDFDSVNDYLDWNMNSIKSSDYTAYVVGERDGSGKSRYLLGGRNRTANQTLNFGYSSNASAMFSQYSNDLSMAVSAYNSPAVTPFILFGELAQTVGHVFREIRDGVETSTSNANTTPLAGTGLDYIGQDPSRNFWDGKIAEIILYSDDLTDAEELKVDSYLAIKYGITLNSTNDYQASDATVIYDSNGAYSDYVDDIAGIGEDTTSGLDQTSSKSEHTDAIVTTSGASSQDDDDYLVWGNDDGATTEKAVGVPSGVAKILSRIWRMNETGDIGTVTMAFDLTGLTISGSAASDFNLIQDTDTTFTSGATLTEANSLSSNIATFTGIDPADGTYFTIGTDAAAVGSLTVDIVDSGGSSVASPSVAFPSLTFSFSTQNSTGDFGTSDEKIRINNGTGTATWTLSLAGSSTTALFIGEATAETYDFNDTSPTADGVDSDSVPGKMRVYPVTTTVTPEGGCTTTGLSAGSTADFNEGVTDSITIYSAGSGADTSCYWDFTGMDLVSSVPPEQPADTYTMDFTLSIIAS